MVCGIPRNSITFAPRSHLCWTASWTAAAEKVVSQKLIPGVLPHIKVAFVGIRKVLGSTHCLTFSYGLLLPLNSSELGLEIITLNSDTAEEKFS